LLQAAERQNQNLNVN